MNFTIDFAGFAAAAAENPVSAALWVLGHGGWVFLLPWAGFIGAAMWLEWRRGIYDAKRKYVVLAFDVPRSTEQTPRAVEQIFSHFSGMHNDPKREDKWIAGEMEESIGLEIVSFGGYVQFLMHVPEQFRDLVEAAVYAQYPEAEITEVEDYAMRWRGIKFPNDRYNMWGAELKLTNKQYYPIRTYREFEDSVSGEFKDPMASILEIFAKLNPDEQAWLQIVITPANNDWGHPGQALVAKLIGARYEAPKRWWEKLLTLPLELIGTVASGLSSGGQTDGKEKTLIPASQMLHLPPGKRSVVESIEHKIAKIGFHTRIRLIYIARTYAFSKATRGSALFGAIKQFNTLEMNGFKPNKRKMTKAYGLFKTQRVNARKNKLMRWYRLRARQYAPGYYGEILNTEELATIWHFPAITVKTPQVKRTEAKRAEPPISLPVAPFEPPSGPPSGSTV
ncbi:MAG: hypothetical protein Q7S23_05670 [bacterium]|nr:hypothetical protein [bacterium]